MQEVSIKVTEFELAETTRLAVIGSGDNMGLNLCNENDMVEISGPRQCVENMLRNALHIIEITKGGAALDA